MSENSKVSELAQEYPYAVGFVLAVIIVGILIGAFVIHALVGVITLFGFIVVGFLTWAIGGMLEEM